MTEGFTPTPLDRGAALYVAGHRGLVGSAIWRKLESEHEQLQVQKRAQATPARVQQLAARQLQMRPVTPGITQYVTAFEPKPATATETER